MSRAGGAWRVWLGVAVFAGGVYWFGYGRREAWSLPVVRPRRGDLARVLREEARTRYREVRTLSMPVDGRLLPQRLEEGDAVPAGAVLAEVEADPSRSVVQRLEGEARALTARRQQAADTRAEQARLTQAEAGARAARAAVSARQAEAGARQAELDDARREQARLADLRARSAATQADLDRAQAALERAQALVQASDAQLAAARAEAAAAAARAAEAQAALEARARQVAELTARGEALDAQLVPARLDAGRTQVEAPFDGRLLAVHHRSGGHLPRGTPLFELGDPTSLEVEVELLSEEAATLTRAGLYAVTGGALGQDERRVFLRQVSPRAFTKRSSLGVEEQRVLAWFRLQGDPPPQLAHGYRVYLEAATHVARDALLVPRRALVRAGEAWGVFVLDAAGNAALVPVSLGVEDEAWVEVTEGLDEGASVLLDVPEELRAGDPVAARDEPDLGAVPRIPGSGG